MTSLWSESMLVLFAILVLGYLAGTVSVRGISLGTSGVLFVALVCGYFGAQVPKEVMDLGLTLYVYCVGIQAGPMFFRTFRRSGWQFSVCLLYTSDAADDLLCVDLGGRRIIKKKKKKK